jgi:fluoroquinolone transport system permease protein
MKKYFFLLKYEMRTILRDPMNIFLLIYPLFMLILIGWLLPLGLYQSGLTNDDLAYSLTMIITFVVFISIGGYISGSLLGFSLLENKDEKTIKSIAVTPVSVAGYVIFKTLYSYFFSIIGNLILILGIKWWANDAYSFSFGTLTFGFDNLNYIHIIVFSIVSSLFVPAIGALIASIAKNKIEGFAFMKSGGIVVMIPALVLINAFTDWKQYILGIAPNFWPVKALLNVALNSQGPNDLPFWAYMSIGGLVMLLLAVISIVAFVKKQNRSE